VIPVLFWFLISLVIYCYLGYPVLLSFIAGLKHRPVKKAVREPSVSVVLSVYNEEDVIERKVRNLLALDYPPAKMEIIIGSDGSSDKTNEMVKKFDDKRIRFEDNPQRRGKMAVLNELVNMAQGEIVVFADARQDFAVNAVKELVANFADPQIGCVSGELIFTPRQDTQGATAKGVNMYWNYEKFLRKQESRIHSMLGATGAIYAIRRELFTEIPPQVILDDMFVPLKIIQKGYRAILDESAQAFDDAADSPREEYRRKARTLSGNYQIFAMFPGMFDPFRSPIALQLFSHKLLRVLAPFLLIAVFLINTLLAGEGFYRGVLFAQIVFYGMALTGALARHQKYGILRLVSRMCYIPYVFCLLNFSALVGFLRFAGARQESAWEKAKR